MKRETRIRRLIAALFLLLAGAGASAHDFHAGELTVSHPWVRLVPPVSAVSAGYMVVLNEGSAPDRLLSASVEVAARTEIHSHTMTDGVMQMRQIESLEIPAGGEARMEPGGFHLMLFELTRPLVENETVRGELEFERAGRLEVWFAVQRQAMGH